MKLTDLALKNTSKNTAGIIESQFGKKLAIASLDAARARTMLEQVSRTIGEYRRQPNFHTSQRSAAYLKAVMLEQALKQRVQEALTPGQTAALSQLAHPGKSMANPSAQDKKDAESIMALIKGAPGSTSATGGVSLGEEYDEDAVMELMAMAEQDMEEGMSCSVREIKDRVNEAAERDGGQLHLRVYPQMERKIAVKRIVESGVYITAGSKVALPDGSVVKARDLSGANNLIFRRNSQSGALEALPKTGQWDGLNSVLHAN